MTTVKALILFAAVFCFVAPTLDVPVEADNRDGGKKKKKDEEKEEDYAFLLRPAQDPALSRLG